MVTTEAAVHGRNGEHIFNNLICPKCKNSHTVLYRLERVEDLSNTVSLVIQLVQFFHRHYQKHRKKIDGQV